MPSVSASMSSTSEGLVNVGAVAGSGSIAPLTPVEEPEVLQVQAVWSYKELSYTKDFVIKKWFWKSCDKET